MDLDGSPMLGFMLDRLSGLAVEHLVVATSDDPSDDPVAEAAEAAGVSVVRGPEHDVLARFGRVLDAHPADVVVRLTADCPLIDAAIVRDALALHERSGADYTSNTLVRTFPDGLDVEVIARAALQAAVDEASTPEEREHVTPFVYRRPERFHLRALCNDEALGEERWTVDTIEDLERIRAIVGRMDDARTAPWLELLAVAGRQAQPAPGELVLTPVCPDGRLDARRWRAGIEGIDIAHVRVDVRDGGEAVLHYDGPDGRRGAVVSLVRRALEADKQVDVLIEEESG
jgi:spore coat polysaccharide biosynthesis protein SpsF